LETKFKHTQAVKMESDDLNATCSWP